MNRLTESYVLHNKFMEFSYEIYTMLVFVKIFFQFINF